jgi:hypothetical protein
MVPFDRYRTIPPANAELLIGVLGSKRDRRWMMVLEVHIGFIHGLPSGELFAVQEEEIPWLGHKARSRMRGATRAIAYGSGGKRRR